MTDQTTSITFDELALAPDILKGLKAVGYENPSPIQEKSIPLLLNGEDLLGQAQTGTGKTAAFALPLLSRVDIAEQSPQILVLTPTRELCIQVAEACQTYSKFLKGFHIIPIYGGQSYGIQLKQLRRGVHMVVGTPGRIMDHIRRGSLKLDKLKTIVLDEADEMLRMGFIDDVEWILEHTPAERQTALFSATMPKEIQRIAQNYLNDPKTVKIQSKTQTATNIRQRYWMVSGVHKMDALTRILEVEEYEAVIIFVRTKTATVEIAEKLNARGHAAEALNGDIPQQNRERIVDRLRDGKLDILVATDVVARGLDVPRISHVLNFDIPYDTESYVHRIGRTGRAGRKGDAILFVSNRERRLLRAIEKATKQTIEAMPLPTVKAVNEIRMQQFKQRIDETLNNADTDLSLFYGLLKSYQEETETDPLHIAAALATQLQGKTPLLLDDKPMRFNERSDRHDRNDRNDRHSRNDREPRAKKEKSKPVDFNNLDKKPLPLKDSPNVDMERFVLHVGYEDGVKPGNIVGAIANEANIESKFIGHIEIFDQISTVDLPAGMPKEVLNQMKKVWICKQRINMTNINEVADGNKGGDSKGSDKARPKKKKQRKSTEAKK
jgi:ATP-dependent RNA helicase DeaD